MMRSPRAILAAGWLVMMLYAFPGYMSYDSVAQLLEGRSGELGGGHPPLMSALWGLVDAVVPGPVGMLVIQTLCFLIGAFILYGRHMSERAAAICASCTLLFPPIAAVMGVIWKDSQMVGYLVLGTALLTSPRRNVRVAGLALLFLATAFRYNALAITLPLVVLLFWWREYAKRWVRYAVAFAAWLGTTVAALVLSGLLVTAQSNVDHLGGLALMDMTGTIRHAGDKSDDELRTDLDGVALATRSGIQDAARREHSADDLDTKARSFGLDGYTRSIWITTYHVFAPPSTDAERAAVSRAWRRVVLGNPGAYLAHRWHIFAELVRFGGANPQNAWVAFTDTADPAGAVEKTGHDAKPSWIQKRLRSLMLWLGDGALFRPWIYLLASLVVLWPCRGRRDLLALALSGIANQTALFFLAPTTDYRYSVWLVTATALVVIQLVSHRARRDTSSV